MDTSTEQNKTGSPAPRCGACLVLVGLAFSVVAMIEFLASFGVFSPLKLAWCWAVGMPLLIVGIFVCEYRGGTRKL